MSAVQESSEIGNSSDIPALNSEVTEKKQDDKPIQIPSDSIKSWRDLEIGIKYKIQWLHTFKRTSKRDAGKTGIDVRLESGYLVLPHRFREIADYYDKHNPKNFYLSYIGRRGARNAYIIQFYDDEKLIKLKTNLKKNEKYSLGIKANQEDEEDCIK